MALLSAIMSFPAFKSDRTLLEQVQTLERLGDEYQKTSGNNIADDILLTTLIRALPRAVQQHIQLGMTNSTTYQEVKDKVVAYERVSSTWTREKILVECGATPLDAVTSYASPGDSGVSPMEGQFWFKREKVRREKVQTRAKVRANPLAMAKAKVRKVRILERASTVQRANTKDSRRAMEATIHNSRRSWTSIHAHTVEKVVTGRKIA